MWNSEKMTLNTIRAFMCLLGKWIESDWLKIMIYSGFCLIFYVITSKIS